MTEDDQRARALLGHVHPDAVRLDDAMLHFGHPRLHLRSTFTSGLLLPAEMPSAKSRTLASLEHDAQQRVAMQSFVVNRLFSFAVAAAIVSIGHRRSLP